MIRKEKARHYEKTIAQRIYIALIFIFLYAPIVTLMVLSFNASKTRAKWGGFTLKWYYELFQNSIILEALYNTLLIAFLSAAFPPVSEPSPASPSTA